MAHAMDSPRQALDGCAHCRVRVAVGRNRDSVDHGCAQPFGRSPRRAWRRRVVAQVGDKSLVSGERGVCPWIFDELHGLRQHQVNRNTKPRLLGQDAVQGAAGSRLQISDGAVAGCPGGDVVHADREAAEVAGRGPRPDHGKHHQECQQQEEEVRIRGREEGHDQSGEEDRRLDAERGGAEACASSCPRRKCLDVVHVTPSRAPNRQCHEAHLRSLRHST